MPRKLLLLIVALSIFATSPAVQAHDIQDLLTELTHRKVDRRLKADQALRELAIGRDPALQEALTDVVAVYRRQLDPYERELTLALLQLMSDNGYDLRPAIAELINFLETRNTGVLCDLMRVLGSVGPDAKLAIPRLKELFSDSNAFLHTRAASALARIDPDQPEYVDSLINCLAAEKDHERWLAAYGLGQVGALANRATPALTKALQDADPTVRVFAAIALWRIDHQAEPVVSTLIRAIDEPGMPAFLKPVAMTAWDFSHSMIAVGALGDMKQDALNALEPLLTRYDKPPKEAEYQNGVFPKQYDSDDQVLRGCILRAMNHVAPADSRVTERTQSALKHPQPYVRSTAKSVVARLEREAARSRCYSGR
jgi:hypothetical protein